jgi:hypothetical protein
MLPHPYSAQILMEFEHQERLREADRERLAASAERSGPTVFVRIGFARRGVAVWVSEQMQRLATYGEGAPRLPWIATRRRRAAA